jgi:DNA-binding CsgD family transcriptional regulator
MRARLFVGVIAGLTVVANLLFGVGWVLAIAAGVAVLMVGEAAGQLIRRRLLTDAAPAKGTSALPDAAIASRAYPLSPRELEVAIWICKGLTSKGVGKKLFIERGTVDTHVGHIYDKLGIDSRPQLAIWLMERGLLPRDSADHADDQKDRELNTRKYK